MLKNHDETYQKFCRTRHTDRNCRCIIKICTKVINEAAFLQFGSVLVAWLCKKQSLQLITGLNYSAKKASENLLEGYP